MMVNNKKPMIDFEDNEMVESECNKKIDDVGKQRKTEYR